MGESHREMNGIYVAIGPSGRRLDRIDHNFGHSFGYSSVTRYHSTASIRSKIFRLFFRHPFSRGPLLCNTAWYHFRYHSLSAFIVIARLTN
jgi:hypothetical protein